MKPDWDSLASEYEGSDKVVIADVDCTAGGKPLCEKFGVKGYPTIKYFNPPDEEGEDYKGARGLADLKKFAASELGRGLLGRRPRELLGRPEGSARRVHQDARRGA